MTYHITIAFFKINYIYTLLCISHRMKLFELFSAYFAFVEDDHSSTLAAAISLL